MTSFKRELAAGRPLLGFLVATPSPQVAQILAAAGADWLMIDMEHGPIDLASLHAMIAATGGTACAPLVRIPLPEPSLAKPVLDAGAFGIVFPMICSREEAEATVRAVRYPPAGERGFGPFYAPARWSMTMEDYLRAANDAVVNVVLIEHADAVARVDDIVSVPGVDAAFIAPFDLSISLGVPGERDHPRVRDAIARAEERILASGVALGGLALTAEDANDKIARGYRLLTVGIDVSLLEGAVKEIIAGIRR